jgi:signal transduction histidine kinase/CheY-like chemotaxis protein
LVALLIVVALGFVLQGSERNTRNEGLSATSLENAANAVLVNSLNAETGVRGFVATGDSRFLQPYILAASQRVEDEKRFVTAAAVGHFGARANAIVADMNKKFVSLRTLIALKRTGAPASAVDTELLAGKVTMDALRAKVAFVEDHESALVVKGSMQISRTETKIEWVDFAGLVLGLLAGLLGALLFTAGISRRLTRAVANAGRLGRGEPLAFEQSSDDEFGELDKAFLETELLLAQSSRQVSISRDETSVALEVNRVKNEFLSRTSHELRTPLNAILGFSQLLEMSELDEVDRDSNEQILKAGRHLLSLINDILDLSRIESEEVRLSVEPVSVRSAVNDVVELMKPLAAQRGITIEHRCTDPSLAAISDRQRFKQILLNLVSNAVKYNIENGVIGIECSAIGEDSIIVTVSDTGLGLSPDDLERIFSPFERLQAVQTDIEGAGIGLAVSAGLATAMSGHISVESTPGQGSTFTIQLPRAPDMMVDIEETVSDAARQRSISVAIVDSRIVANVLYIEDNEANIQLVQKFFERRFASTILVAKTGESGLALAREHLPNVVLLDRHLPDQMGDEVFERLRGDPRTSAIPVIMISADASPVTLRRLLAKGLAAYLTKPIDFVELEALLRTLEEPASAGAN